MASILFLNPDTPLSETSASSNPKKIKSKHGPFGFLLIILVSKMDAMQKLNLWFGIPPGPLKILKLPGQQCTKAYYNEYFFRITIVYRN
jgi:hypothetical protein